jgi:hypothetical protein
MEAGGIGRVAVRHLFLAVTGAAARAGTPVGLHSPSPIGPEDETPLRPAPTKKVARAVGLLETWQRHLARLPDDQRRAMTLHAGLDGSPRLTSAAAGEAMGITGAKAYRLDRQATDWLSRQGFFVQRARARFEAALRAPRVRLEKLASDSWWSEAVLLPQALDYFAESVLEMASVLEVDGQLCLARWDPDEG